MDLFSTQEGISTYFFKMHVINNDKLLQDRNVTDPENGQEKNEDEEHPPLHHNAYQRVQNDCNDNNNNALDK